MHPRDSQISGRIVQDERVSHRQFARFGGFSLNIALAFQRSVYDSVYIALAVTLNTYLVTADERLANAVAAKLPVKWLGAL